jgi:hypothetical protein
MIKTVEGIYQDGRVEFVEQPAETTGNPIQVLVTFLDASSTDPTKLPQLRQDLQVGLDQLSQGQSLDYTADTVHELFDEVKSQGQAELGGDR